MDGGTKSHIGGIAGLLATRIEWRLGKSVAADIAATIPEVYHSVNNIFQNAWFGWHIKREILFNTMKLTSAGNDDSQTPEKKDLMAAQVGK